jgi:ABC-2 type transport system permease protein
MTSVDSASDDPRRPSPFRLLTAQVSYQVRLLVRSPIAAFATLVIPLMVLLAVNLLFSGTRLRVRGDIRYAQFFTPAMVAFAVLSACYMSVISSTVLAREQGILKRLRSTPLPPWIYMAGRLIAAGLVALVSAIVVIAVGAWVYDFEIVWGAIPTVLLTLAVAMFCFCSLGLAVTVLVPSAESALAIAWGTILPLCFISDMFQPIDNAPHGLRQAASFIPLRPFADDLESAFNPVTGGTAVHWGHLELLGAWGLAAAAFALLLFRWEPDGRHRHKRGSRRSATVAVDHVRGLLAERHPRRPSPPPPRPQSRPAPGVTGGRATEPQLTEERIEGPAPAEDSSVPPDMLTARPARPAGSTTATTRSTSL